MTKRNRKQTTEMEWRNEMKTTQKTMKLVPILVSFAASTVFAVSLSVPLLGCNGDKKEVKTKQSKEATFDKEKAEKESRSVKQNADEERKAKEESEEERRLAQQKAEEPQKTGGNSGKKLESIFGIEFGWKKPDGWKDSEYLMFDVVPAYDFSPKKKFLSFDVYTVLFDGEGKAFFVRAIKDCENLEEAYKLKRKAIEMIELKYGVMDTEGIPGLATGKVSLDAARGYFGDGLLKRVLKEASAKIVFADGKRIVVGQRDNTVVVYGDDPLRLESAKDAYRRRQTIDAVDSL